jgi:uncharacterized membrane protein
MNEISYEEGDTGYCILCGCRMYIDSFGKPQSKNPAPGCLCEMELDYEFKSLGGDNLD